MVFGVSSALVLAACCCSSRVHAAAPEPTSNDTARDTRLDNPSTYEFAFLSIGIEQAFSLSGHSLFIGGGGGLGPPLYRLSQMKCAGSSNTCDDKDTRSIGLDPSLEIAYGNLFVRWSPVPQLDVDVGPKIAIASTLYNVPDAPRSNFTYGVYADLRIGTETIKIGPRFEFGRTAYADFYEMGWKLTPLMLRVLH